MKILLIGHSIIDHYNISEEIITKPGGIFYSATGFLSLKQPEDEIYLLSGVSKKYLHLFERAYGKINNSLLFDLEDMPEVCLTIYKDKERGEVYKNLSSNLPIEKINNWNMFDGILINMITGFDLAVEQITLIRKSFGGPIYLDIHTLSRGIDANMKREFHKIPLIEKWLSNVDILQCNENELRTVFDLGSELDSAKKILECGPRILIITKGEKGAVLYCRGDKKIVKKENTAEKVNVVNKIGCGDIFGAVFFYSYLNSRNTDKSLIKANKVAGTSVSHNIIDNPDILKKYV